MALHVSGAGAGTHAASPDALVQIAAPIYAALIAPWVSLVHTEGGRPKSVEMATAALAQAQVLYAIAGGLPVNTVVPYVQQVGPLLTCTMGEWVGEPTSYAYQWVSDGETPIGSGEATYQTVAADVGHTVSCTVVATNAAGSSAAAPSNGVVVQALAEAA